MLCAPGTPEVVGPLRDRIAQETGLPIKMCLQVSTSDNGDPDIALRVNRYLRDWWDWDRDPEGPEYVLPDWEPNPGEGPGVGPDERWRSKPQRGVHFDYMDRAVLRDIVRETRVALAQDGRVTVNPQVSLYSTPRINVRSAPDDAELAAHQSAREAVSDVDWFYTGFYAWHNYEHTEAEGQEHRERARKGLASIFDLAEGRPVVPAFDPALPDAAEQARSILSVVKADYDQRVDTICLWFNCTDPNLAQANADAFDRIAPVVACWRD